MAVLQRQKQGFSLVEMVVVLGVMVMVMTLMFANFPKIKDQIALTLATRELALSTRKAQSYAIAVREFDPSFPVNLCNSSYDVSQGSVRFPPYGIAVAKQNDGNGNNKFTYSIFGDTNCNAFLSQFPVYQSASEFVSSVKIQNGVQISDIDGYIGNGSAIALRYAQIIYQRPNPSVTLVGTTQAGGSTGTYSGRLEITLTSGSGAQQKIVVRPSGQISIE